MIVTFLGTEPGLLSACKNANKKETHCCASFLFA